MPNTAKTPNGLGTVYQRKDGYWVAAVSLGGKRIVKYAPNRKAAQEKLNELVGNGRAGMLRPTTKLTLAGFLDQWLEAVGPDLKPKTLAGYRQDCINHISPLLGHIRLQRLEATHVVTAIGQWRKGASPGMVNHVYRSLRRALNVAARWGLIGTNPCNRVDPPRPEYREATVWTAEQTRAFLRAAEGDRCYPLWCFLAATGARLGEALGAEWTDLNPVLGTLAIRRGLTWLGGTPILSSPKTRASLRTVTLPAFVLDALSHWRAVQAQDRLLAGSTWQNDRGAIFTSTAGRPLSETYLRRTFLAACERAEVPPCRLHDLRHAAASMLVSAGLDPKTVQARLGHATLAMTLGLYAHVAPGADRLAADALERAIAG